MPVKRRQHLAVTDRGLYYKEERFEQNHFVHFTMLMNVIMMTRVIMKTMNSSSYWRVLPIVAIKQFHQFFIS